MDPQIKAGIQAIAQKYNYKPPQAASTTASDWFTATTPPPRKPTIGDMNASVGRDIGKVASGFKNFVNQWGGNTAESSTDAANKVIGGVTTAADTLAQNNTGEVAEDLPTTINKVGAVAEGIGESGAGLIEGGLAPVTALIKTALPKSRQTPESIQAGKDIGVLREPNDAEIGLSKLVKDNPRTAKNLQNLLTLATAGIGGEAGIAGRTIAERSAKDVLTTAGKEMAASTKAGAAAAGGLAKDVTEATIDAATRVGSKVLSPVIHPIKTTKDAASASFEAVKNISARMVYGSDAEKLQSSLKASYDKVSIPKGIVQVEARSGKDFSDFMSKKPYLSMPVKNGEWDTYTTGQTLRTEVKPEAQALQSLLDNTQEMVSEQKIVTEVQSAINKIVSGQERAGMQAWASREIPTLVDQMGGVTALGPNGERMISIGSLNKIKQVLWDRSPFVQNASSLDKLKSSVDYSMGQVLKKNIEATVTDADILALNAEIGDYYHAIEVLEKMHGGKAPGGGISGALARTAGAIAGAPMGGPIGSIVGYMTADQIAVLMMSPEVTTSLKRLALDQLQVARPTVAQKVGEILEKRAAENAARPKLNAPESIYVEPKGTPNQRFGTTPVVETQTVPE